MEQIKKADGFKYQKLIVNDDSISLFFRSCGHTKDIYVTDIGFFPDALHHFRERVYGCDSYIIIFCVDGEGFYSVEEGEPVCLQKGSVLILPRNIPHRYWASSSDPWSIYFFHVQGDVVDEFYAKIAIKYSFSLNYHEQAKFIELFEECYSCLKNPEHEDLLIFSSKIIDYLWLFLIICSSQAISGKLKKASAEDKTVKTTIEFMKENLHNNLTLDDICRNVGFSKSYFTKIFKNATGYPPLEYFFRLKVQASCVILEATDLSVKQISHTFNYGDSLYFSRLFKKYIGISPQKYRRRSRGSSPTLQ